MWRLEGASVLYLDTDTLRTRLQEENNLIGPIEGMVIPQQSKLISPTRTRQQQAIDGFEVSTQESLIQRVDAFRSDLVDISFRWRVGFELGRRLEFVVACFDT